MPSKVTQVSYTVTDVAVKHVFAEAGVVRVVIATARSGALPVGPQGKALPAQGERMAILKDEVLAAQIIQLASDAVDAIEAEHK